MIEVRDLVKSYGSNRAVDGISFTLNEGDILGFLGPNGAGKSTTMRILTGFTPPTDGEVRIGGYDIRQQSMEARRLIGYLPENIPIYRNMEVRPYLDFMAEVKGLSRTNRRACVDRALEETGLTDVPYRRIGNLSKGYRQRVCFAQALLGDPPVLILDEPTVGLDPMQISEIRELIRRMAGKRTVILSTHILPEVSMTCGKVIIINLGRIEAHGTPESLVTDLEDPRYILATVSGDADAVIAVLKDVAGDDEVSRERVTGPDSAVYRVPLKDGVDIRSRIAVALVEGKFMLHELQSQGSTLEDIFLRVITRQKVEAGD
jgi:ABC-2 type transport system ATP-binding protein